LTDVNYIIWLIFINDSRDRTRDPSPPDPGPFSPEPECAPPKPPESAAKCSFRARIEQFVADLGRENWEVI